MNQPGKLSPIKLMDSDALSALARRTLEHNHSISSVLVLAYNGSVFAEAHRTGSQIHSSGSPPVSASPAAAFDSAITTTRSLRTQAITYATAYLSYARDLNPDVDSSAGSPSSSKASAEYLEQEPITFESRKSPSITIISPVGDRILLAVTGDFGKPKSDRGDADSSTPTNGPALAASEAAAMTTTTTVTTTPTATPHEDEDILDSTPEPLAASEEGRDESSQPAPFHQVSGSAVLNGPGASSASDEDAAGRLTPPPDLADSLKEISEALVERLRTEFQGMKWPSDL